MAKKQTKKRDDKELEALLTSVLSELESLTRNEKKTARELQMLKKQIKNIKPCKCRKPKKKKRKSKSEGETTSSGVARASAGSSVSDANCNVTPIGLLNIVSEPVGGVADDLKMIAGVGPKLEGVLNELGIFHFEQIANWSRSEIDWVDDYLQFPGRIERDEWVRQAKALVEGGRDEYVRVFGKEPR